jgi:hypothetical protein
MESEGAALAWPAPRSSGRFSLALVFLLAIVFGLLSTVPFLAFALVYGASTAESILQTDMADILWLLRSWEFAFFLIFYQLGKRFDFRSRYLQLTALSFVGVFLGALPELVSVQTAPGTSSAVFGFSFEEVGLANSLPLFVAYFYSAFQDFAFPLAGLALAFLVEEGRLSPAWGWSRLLSPRALALCFGITTAAYLASAVTDVVGSRMLPSAYFALSPYGDYAFDLFYPALFFVVFYFAGRRLEGSRAGVTGFAVSLLAAGVLGYLVGDPLAYYIRAFAGLLGNPSPPLPLGLSFLGAFTCSSWVSRPRPSGSSGACDAGQNP